MKKYISCLIALSFLVLTACSQTPASAEVNDLPDPSSSSAATSSPAATPAPVSVYTDDKVTISYAFAASDGIHFYVKNQTDANITIQADSISVNGLSTNDILMSDDVAPQSTGEVIAQCNVDLSTPVVTIGGQLRVIDFNNSFETYNASFVNVPVTADGASNQVTAPAPTSPLLYEDDKVSIYYASVDKTGVHFQVQNHTDANVTIQADSISVNGLSVNDIIMSDNVAPQSTGEVIAKCSVDTTNPVETIGGQLRVIDFNGSFSSYNASFVNVPVSGTTTPSETLSSSGSASATDTSYTTASDFLTYLYAFGSIEDAPSYQGSDALHGIYFQKDGLSFGSTIVYETTDDTVSSVFIQVDNSHDGQDELLALCTILLAFRPDIDTDTNMGAISSAISNEGTIITVDEENLALMYDSNDLLTIVDSRTIDL